MTTKEIPSPKNVWAFEVSCLVIASSQQEALEKLSTILSETDRYWIEEGEPVTEEEVAREVPPG